MKFQYNSRFSRFPDILRTLILIPAIFYIIISPSFYAQFFKPKRGAQIIPTYKGKLSHEGANPSNLEQNSTMENNFMARMARMNYPTFLMIKVVDFMTNNDIL